MKRPCYTLKKKFLVKGEILIISKKRVFKNSIPVHCPNSIMEYPHWNVKLTKAN